MFAIDHAATALLIKKRFPRQSIVWLLISVQLMEILWVVLNFLGVERTVTEATVSSLVDIHLIHMPYAHSVATMLAAAILAWAIVRFVFRRPRLSLAVGLGVASHLMLDLLTHARDLALAPGLTQMKLGLYSAAPLAALILELIYGVFCWWVYRGGRALLAVIVLFNLANLSILSPRIPGPESLLAGRPSLIVGFTAAQIAVTLVLVGYYSRREVTTSSAPAPS